LPAPQAVSAPNCCACNSADAREIESRLLWPQLVEQARGWPSQSSTLPNIPPDFS
jgi:hypothetical protein